MRIGAPYLSVIACLVFSSNAHADKRYDFKAAADVARSGTESCDTIPYYDLRNSCTYARSDKARYCDGGNGPVSCEANLTGSIRIRQANAERDKSSLLDRKSSLESSRSSAIDDAEKSKLDDEIRRVSDEIRIVEEKITVANKEIDQRRKDVDEALYNIDKCIAARQAALYSFGDALDRVRTELNNARNNPEAEVDAADAEVLRDTYEASKRGHRMQITEKENSQNLCKAERPWW